ncbi:MAG TPA: indolepyruvate ferredoxin oxidoreductase subunit alpha [Methanobacteriaceae archaeon]|nr:indolepyruvate ferredoxin oxidoreductase subunit alpha [Methanobacteriaceae archaeon]
MNLNDILTGKEDEKLFLLGNEAAVRGAIEAGVKVAATYPGTPSSEIGDVLHCLAKEAGIYFEFSINEKVAMEVAAAAAASGVRSFTFMKHVGLNVASDSLMSAVYTGVRGGMVILVADDPSMFSSQNEQDSRHYARLANLPLLEPSNPQEVKDFMLEAFQISETFEIPVLVRTTTRISHMRGIVQLGPVEKRPEKGFFQKDPKRFVPIPATARVMHQKLVQKIEKITGLVEKSFLNKQCHQDGNVGIIATSSAFNYCIDVIEEDELPLKVLKLGFSYPFPEKTVLNFLNSVERVIVVEEVDPIMEKEILAIIGKYGLNVEVNGKLDGFLPLIYEYTPDIVREAVYNVLGLKMENFLIQESNLPLPNRPPTLCPGCPHRAAYYAVKKAAKDLELSDVIHPTDIGCYTLGVESPYESADYLLSMGSSIGSSCGFSKATDQPVVSFIGDSTFFHAGIPPLINAVHNKNRFVLVILDNRTTAMTGGQPHPGLPIDGLGDLAPEISIEDLVKAIGVSYMKTINPLNIKKSVEIFQEALQDQGVAVVISKYPCVLIKKSQKRGISQLVVTDSCDGCGECLSTLACPALYQADDKIEIDPLLCRKCNVCVQTCPQGAIKGRRTDK